MKSLDDILNIVEAPEPSDTLKARILRDAKAQRTEESRPVAANDNRWKKWAAIAAAAIILGVFGVTTLTPTTDITEDTLWAETAEEIGYDDLYAWVNGDDTDSRGNEESSLSPETLPV